MLVIWMIDICLRKDGCVSLNWEKLIDFIECHSRFEPETSQTGDWASTYLLICRMGYISGDRKPTHLTHSKILIETP
jgi:hypothetical protein